MAIPQSATPIYHDPAPTRNRRSPSRKSFPSSLSRSPSHLDSPRTACPKDGDAFSYNPSHLRKWYLPQELWDRLPAQLQSSLAAVQHSGAAVMTGFERLDRQLEHVDGGKVHVDELMVRLDDLPAPKLRTISNASSFFQSDLSSPFNGGSPASQSGCASPVMSSSLSLSQTMRPASPISLGPPGISEKRNRSRDRSFSTPLEPHDAYYVTELSHLRTEALVRLRHKCRNVDTEWYEAKRTGNIASEDVNAFENWWAEKKCNMLCLNMQGNRLATAVGVANTGMGWCAP